jgi:hypothetical protein
MVLEKRVYQGISGLVYPHPVIDRVFDEKEDKVYTSFFAPQGMESEYCLAAVSYSRLEDDAHIPAEVDGKGYLEVEPGAECSFTLSTAEGKTVRVTTLTRVEAEHACSC